MRAALTLLSALALADPNSSCEDNSSDAVQRKQQESILAEGTAATGMPAIHNFRERRQLKLIYELRDQENYATFTYVWSDVQGRGVFFCHSIGFGIPYATEYTSPEKPYYTSGAGNIAVPQADPNGLFSPASAEGTWVTCKDPSGPDIHPVYVEPRIVVVPFDVPAWDVPLAPAAPTALPAKK